MAPTGEFRCCMAEKLGVMMGGMVGLEGESTGGSVRWGGAAAFLAF